MALSISVCLNGTQADVLQRPELCDEAISLGNKFLNKVTLARDFWHALKEPRPLKSRKSFLRFVFERRHSLDQQSRNRQLRLRAMSSISLVLCSATFTENMILNFSGELFNTLLAHVGEFLGNPKAVISELPDDVIRTCFTTKMIPESAKAYAQFCSEIDKHQNCKKVVKTLGVVPYRDARADEVINWPQEQVSGILRGAQSAAFSVVLRQLARLYKETGRSIPFSNDVTEAFIASSKSRPLHERMHPLDAAAEMLTDEAPVSAWTAIVHQRSVVLRLQGDPRRAELEIRAYLSKRSHIPDHLLHVLQLSLANNCIYQLRHDRYGWHGFLVHAASVS